MSILEKLNTLIDELNIPVETGVFNGNIPPAYVVLTPLNDNYELFGDNKPLAETSEVRVSLFNFGNYTEIKDNLCEAIIENNLTITNRLYVGFDTETGYHNYAIDVADISTKEEFEDGNDRT